MFNGKSSFASSKLKISSVGRWDKASAATFSLPEYTAGPCHILQGVGVDEGPCQRHGWRADG